MQISKEEVDEIIQPIKKTDLISVFKKEVFIQLEQNDIYSNDPFLRKTPEANVQGEHRYARGKYFYSKSEENALNNNYKFI